MSEGYFVLLPSSNHPHKGVWGFSSGESQGKTEILIWEEPEILIWEKPPQK